MTSIPIEEVFQGRSGIDIDQMRVNAKDLQLARGGDPEAFTRLRKAADGLELYFHLIGTRGDDELVTIRELCELGVIESITVKARLP